MSSFLPTPYSDLTIRVPSFLPFPLLLPLSKSVASLLGSVRRCRRGKLYVSVCVWGGGGGGWRSTLLLSRSSVATLSGSVRRVRRESGVVGGGTLLLSQSSVGSLSGSVRRVPRAEWVWGWGVVFCFHSPLLLPFRVCTKPSRRRRG